MPVRVRCPQCEKVVNAPDAARGKAVKCPECETRIPVPAGDEEAAPKAKAGKPAAKSPPAKSAPAKSATAKKKATADDDDFLAKLDLSRSEDRNTRVCPKCGQVVDEEDTECAACGVDLQTGGLGKTARKARMKWADPNDFYPIAWKDATEFVKQNFALTMKTWSNMLFLVFSAAVCGGIAGAFAIFDHTPSVVLFGTVAALLTIGTVGWFLSLSNKVIQFTLDKKIVLDRTNFETFTAMATGISWVVWFVASAAPFAVIIVPVYLFTRESGELINYGLTAAVTLFFVCLPMPCVMAHRAMPVNWMIWVSPLMWKIAGKTIGGVLYTWVIAFVTWLPIGLLVVGEVFVLKTFLVCTLNAFGLKATGGIVEKTAEAGFPFSEGSISIVGAIFVVLLAILLRAATTFLYTVWAMYMVRVVAQFTFYNKKNLELIGQLKEKKYVAKQVELGEDGQPIQKTGTAGMIAGIIAGIIVLYVVANVVLYFVAPGYLLMPRSLAVMLKLVE